MKIILTIREVEIITNALMRERIRQTKIRDKEPINSYYWNCWQEEIKETGELEDRLYTLLKTIE